MAAAPKSGKRKKFVMMGVVGFGPNNQPDPVRRVLTFTTAPLERELEIAGPIKLVLHASSTRNDMDFFVKLSEQMPQSSEDRAKDLNPAYFWITKGWLRASHRALDGQKSTEMEPYHLHTRPEPITPGEVTKYDISVEPNAFQFKKGNRIRLEIAKAKRFACCEATRVGGEYDMSGYGPGRRYSVIVRVYFGSAPTTALRGEAQHALERLQLPASR